MKGRWYTNLGDSIDHAIIEFVPDDTIPSMGLDQSENYATFSEAKRALVKHHADLAYAHRQAVKMARALKKGKK